MAKARRTILAMLAALVVATLALGGVALAQQEGTTVSPSATAPTEGTGEQLRVEEPGSGTPGPLSEAQKRLKSQGYLVPDQQAYERAKAQAAQEAGQPSGTSAPVTAATQAAETFRRWKGIRDPECCTPSDSTGAIGPTRYVELINTKYAIYDRTSDDPLSKGDLSRLIGVPRSNFTTDPQIIWDATTGRFYYVVLSSVSATDNRLAFGFSKTADPTSPADFCKYTLTYGSTIPDYPKLGDTEGLLLIGVNAFLQVNEERERYFGSDLVSITKPPAGTTCPAPGEFTVDARQRLRGADGERAFTPVPANQIDTRATGHVVATTPRFLPEPNLLSLYSVGENADGTMNLSAAAGVSVPSYVPFPADAPQPGTRNVLDTLDSRITQAVEAFDPSPGTMALWTQHTVFGGSGAEVRWYEIDPTSPSPRVLQRGRLSSSRGTYFFNAAISPDRKFDGTTGAYGNAMVMGYNTSSEEQRPDIRMVSKVGSSGPVSEQDIVKRSPAIMNDFICRRLGFQCRWGDYSAATPDPAAPGGARTGQVWLTNQWVPFPGGRKTDPRSFGWGTWNWAAKP
jgi:hypothetical protein